MACSHDKGSTQHRYTKLHYNIIYFYGAHTYSHGINKLCNRAKRIAYSQLLVDYIKPHKLIYPWNNYNNVFISSNTISFSILPGVFQYVFAQTLTHTYPGMFIITDITKPVSNEFHTTSIRTYEIHILWNITRIIVYEV